MMWILVILGLLLVIYRYFIKPLSYWSKCGVQQDSFWESFLFNWGLFIGRQPFPYSLQSVYNRFPKARYLGFYQFNTPALMIKHPDLIKAVTIKDFDHFMNHRQFIPEDADLLWSNNLLALTGQKWKDVRTTVSPCFTSTKMKHMFTLIEETSKNFTQYFENLGQKEVEVELKDVFTRFANDVIATTAFGVQVDSLKDKDNHFYSMGKKLSDLSQPKGIFRFLMFMLFPTLSKSLNLSLFDEDVKDFFINLTKDVIKVRREKNIVRPDLIHLLMEAQKGVLEESESGRRVQLSDMDIAAQAMSFFFAGFDTVSSLMCFMGYELALHPEIQSKLRKEIQTTLNQCNGQLTYEALLGMKYLDMVVSEVLRKWPINAAVDRLCTKPYIIKATNEDEVDTEIPAGTIIWLAIFPLHHDPQYYPNPEKFDPERFSEENKAKITPYTYLPFGVGPRNCMGSRLALLETKIIFCHILNNFEIVPSAKSTIPLVLSKKQFVMNSDDGFWFQFKMLDK